MENSVVRMIMRPPGDALRRALSGHPDRDRIDPERARSQHGAFVEALETAGVVVTLLPTEADMPDACFTSDTLLAFSRPGELQTALVVATLPGAPTRRPEVPSVLACARRMAPGADVVEIRDPGTLDGGDVLIFGGRVAIGVSARTNEAGARQLATAAGRFGYRAFLCPVDDRLHLASGVTPLSARRLIGTRSGFQSLDAAGPEVAPDDVERLVIEDKAAGGANVLVAGGRCFVARGFPSAVATLASAGESVVEVELDEFLFADGGPTCLVVAI